MPGRASTRTPRASGAAVPRKSSTQPPKSRGSASARASAYAVEIPDEGPNTVLREHVCAVFADAQRGPASQRKLVVTLRKLQEICCYEPAEPRKQQQQLDREYDEVDFNAEVCRCVLRTLTVKKSEPVGDRLVKFLGLFLKNASEKDNAIFANPDADTTDAFPETPTSRLTSEILSQALQVITAKDKVVRYRVTQIVAHIVNTLDSIDDELFQFVRLALMKRLRDKESIVRVQAVLGLGRLADENEDDQDNDDSDDDAGGVLDRLREALQHDPSADVRRALLLNLPFTPGTLPYLLERARDLDAATRRALYSRLLPALGDFRHLSLTHREKLLRWGMRDRDENVRKATARLFRERWIEDCAASHQTEGEEEEQEKAQQKSHEPNLDALLELLERIDVVNSGVEGGIAHEAMKEFWDGRPDYRDYISFEDPFFDTLTPESAFVARTFNQYCRQSKEVKLQSMLEDKMPEVTKFAFLLQRHLEALIKGVEKVALDPEDAEAEEETVQQEFCVEQMLHIALTLDYSDEMGRRKMFSIMRETLALAELPEECTRLIVEILRTVCADEQEFCSIVLEAVAEVHDTIMGDAGEKEAEDVDESFHSARSEQTDSTPTKASKRPQTATSETSQDDEDKAIREIMVNMKCLHIAQCMLQNVQCDLERNVHLVTMLNNLVVPAVRSQEAPIRERGLCCLGLCCMLSKNLANENLTLFLHCFSKGHEALQVIAIQIITDILTTQPSLLAPPPSTEEEETELPNPLLKPIYKMYSRGLRSEETQVQTTACTALSKLMLASTIRDPDLLKQLVLAYFDPETRSNPSLRQSLTYFLPVYCHSRRANAVSMARVAVPIMRALAERADDLDEEEEMVGMSMVAAQIADWTDPRKEAGFGEGKDSGAEDGHLVLAEELLEKVLTPGCTKEERKIFVTLLGKLHVNVNAPAEALQTIADLVNEAFEGKVASEVSTRNALTKLQNTVAKLLTASTGTSKEQSRDASFEEAPGAPPSDEMDVDEDMTVMTKFTQLPDAEGTVYGSGDDEDDDATVVGKTKGDESLVSDLLDDDSIL
ncbi:hypothetical protein EJ06DRAFT_489758 [Trichodelitschia bisporula]|uniref:Nuclear condensin complex subunit 3 C-terminal domain-containing protein n=1 Tax=Trichodelitschia bisporula TaxID=703511 RepID=A0A6G1I4P4_9PEZI|nr:hypothetical protein EJ06DRAFT_489758 [Trichodelitschia bisporula]